MCCFHNRRQILLNNIDILPDYARTVFIYVIWKTWILYRPPGGKTGDTKPWWFVANEWHCYHLCHNIINSS